MGKELAALVFDYSAISKDAKGKLIYLAGEIQKQNAGHVKTGLEVGRLLSEARSLLASEQPFKAWVEAECGHSLRSAYNYIAAFDSFGSCANFARIELSAMYELTKNDNAKNRALKLAERGVRVTHAIAKDLVESEKDESAAGGGRSPAEPSRVRSPGPTASVSEKGKPGGAPRASSSSAPPSPVPASGEAADFGTCPNCNGKKWTEDEFGAVCAKCNHPHGEPVGDQDEDRIGTQRAKTVKTVEALMRAFDDLNRLMPKEWHLEAMASCKYLLKSARGWK